ncbi:hypothetical protein [Desulfuromonas thiophila]|uniref:hypothetical protein n=1 Tax=Desulfuromonas thiophila TaxID=57664 RepID=UPI0029F5B951|nr:hypothetical protein [Desulfuromonas thiophila]
MEKSEFNGKTSFVFITPQVASEMLKNNKGNRPISPARADKYVQDMRMGNWKITHQGIAFDSAGNLIDGQHRLLAIVKSGKSIMMNVSYGLDADVFDVLDTGGNRSRADVLSIAGHPPRVARIISAAIPYCITYDAGFVPSKNFPRKHGNTNIATLEYFQFNAPLADSALFITKMPRRDAIIKESIACFMHYQISKKHKDADDFIQQVLTGDGVTARTAVFEIRKMLIASRIGNHRMIEQVAINRIIAAYNYFHSGKNLSDPYQAINKIQSSSNVRIV